MTARTGIGRLDDRSPRAGAPARPLNIAFVEPHLEIYGGIRRIVEISNRLKRMGENVTIYHPRGEPCRWLETAAEVRPLRELFDGEHDVVVFNDPPDYKHVRRAKAKLKVFYVLALYEAEKLKRFNPKIFWPKKGRMLSLKRALQMPFLKISNATWMQAYLKNELGIDTLLVIGGVNRDIFHPVDVQRDGGVFRILCSGDPREHKGTATVREAVERVRRRHPHVILDSYFGKGLPQSEMARVYASADLFVDGQWHAGWNNPVAEAMACGAPVVCTEIGGVADFAFHERTALLVPVGDARGMAEAIARLIDDEALRTRLKIKAYEHIAQFDWDLTAAAFRRILRERVI